MNTNTEMTDAAAREQRSGRLPSLAAQTPGLDTFQEASTLRDAEAYYAGTGDQAGGHILVPLDGSRLAATTLPYVAALARATAARIRLLAVLEPFPDHNGIPSAAAREGDERRVTESTAYLESVANPLRQRGFAVTAVIRHGNPADAILNDSEAEGCSLIVMSTHGRTGLARVRMGSVAQHVFRHASIPTLVVRPGDAESTADPAVITSVTVTLDGSATAEEALPHAARFAAALAIPLRLFRVIPSMRYPSFAGWGAGYASYYPETEELQIADERAVAEYLDAIAVRLRASGLAVQTDWERSVTGRGDELIAAYLAQCPNGLAVMASHGRGGVLRWALGSTTEAVLDQAPCPILIVQAGTATTTGHEVLPDRALQPAD